MDRELILLVVYTHADASLTREKFKLQKETLEKSILGFPEDIRKKYFVSSIFLPTEDNSRVECLFPKEPDTDMLEKINELSKKQNELASWIQTK